jgi:hypothetical protein
MEPQSKLDLPDPSSREALVESVEWLKVLLSLVAAALLAVVFVLVPVDGQSSRWLQLLMATIPEALVVLVAIPIIYFLLQRRGLTSEQHLSARLEQALRRPFLSDERQVQHLVEEIAEKLGKSGLLNTDAEYCADFFSAARRIKAAICDGRNRHTVKIRVVTARGTLEAYLNEIAETYTGMLDVELQVADFSALPQDMVDPRWPTEQSNTIARIKDHCRAKGYRLSVWKYPYTTSVIGHLIDDQHLLMAYYFWDKRTGAIADLQEWYIYFRRGPTTNKFFDLFENWFDHAPRRPWTI